MILVILGTQNKSFTRLLQAIDSVCEQELINEKIIVQAGVTKYESPYFEVFDYCDSDQFIEYIKQASYVICHGGVGTIMQALKYDKRIIAAAREAKYKEHHNDHQKQILENFSNQGYLLYLEDFSNLANLVENISSFKPKKFVANNDKMINLIEDYIQKN